MRSSLPDFRVVARSTNYSVSVENRRTFQLRRSVASDNPTICSSHSKLRVSRHFYSHHFTYERIWFPDRDRWHRRNGDAIALVRPRCDLNALVFNVVTISLPRTSFPGTSHLIQCTKQNHKRLGYHWRRKGGPALV